MEPGTSRENTEKVMGEGLRLELVGETGGQLCLGTAFLYRGKEHERRKRKEQKTENVKVNFPAKDRVSDVINLFDFGYAVS